MRKKVLNVGGNNRAIPLPAYFQDWDVHLLDIDPASEPDLLMDARELVNAEEASYDAVYSSHCLEHFYFHDVPKVLAGFRHVLKSGGFAFVKVPDVLALMHMTLGNRLDLDDVIYQSAAGPIMVVDVLFGYTKEIEESGQDFFSHKTGFSPGTLERRLNEAGFVGVQVGVGKLEVVAMAFKDVADPTLVSTLGFR